MESGKTTGSHRLLLHNNSSPRGTHARLMPYAVKIIEISEGDQNFTLNEDALRKILYAIPENRPIAIVSVVGAFRTGKSFILDFFLRYLKSGKRDGEDDNDDEPSQAWLNDFVLTGNQNSDLNKGQDALQASREFLLG
jgi:atlastin